MQGKDRHSMSLRLCKYHEASIHRPSVGWREMNRLLVEGSKPEQVASDWFAFDPYEARFAVISVFFHFVVYHMLLVPRYQLLQDATKTPKMLRRRFAGNECSVGGYLSCRKQSSRVMKSGQMRFSADDPEASARKPSPIHKNEKLVRSKTQP